MIISSQFNRFYHRAIITEIKRINTPISFYNRFKIRFSALSIKSIKTMLKMLDLNYPRNSMQEVISIKDIESKELCEHIEFIFKTLAENSITLKVIEDEWERLLKQGA